MKRRILKKKVNHLCSELFAECIALSQYNLVANRKDADNVMTSILNMHVDLVARISHVQPGNVKNFFKKLRLDSRTRTEEIITQMQNLL